MTIWHVHFRDNVNYLLDQSGQLCEGLLKVGATEWPYHVNHQAIVTLDTVTAVHNQLNSNKTKVCCHIRISR